MYNQQEEDDSLLPSGGKIFAATAGLTGAAFAGRYLGRPLEKALWYKYARNHGNVAGPARSQDNWIGRMADKYGYDPRNPKNYSKNMSELSARNIKDDIKMFGFRGREANKWDMAVHKMYGRDIKAGAKVLKAPVALAFGVMTINQQLDERGNLSGLATGVANEAIAAVTGRIGMAAGSMLGHALTGGFVMGGPIGMVVGGAIGAMGGFAAISAAEKLAKLGRKWSLPELGGNFQDSQMAMTMRARSLNAIRTSQFNLRSELGNEALHLSGL